MLVCACFQSVGRATYGTRKHLLHALPFSALKKLSYSYTAHTALACLNPTSMCEHCYGKP